MLHFVSVYMKSFTLLTLEQLTTIRGLDISFYVFLTRPNPIFYYQPNSIFNQSKRNLSEQIKLNLKTSLKSKPLMKLKAFNKNVLGYLCCSIHSVEVNEGNVNLTLSVRLSIK